MNDSKSREKEKNELFTNNRVQLLIGKFFTEGLKRLLPVLDRGLGYRYPGVEDFLDNPKEAESFLELLTNEKLMTSETCGVIARCKNCGSFGVDHILSQEKGKNAMFICQDCGATLSEKEINFKPVFCYQFSEKGIEKISDKLIVKPIIDFLHERGYLTESPGILRGASEVDHLFDIIARSEEQDTGILAIDFKISTDSVTETSVSSMFAKVYDTNPIRSILIAFPRLTMKAKRLAKQYEIDVIETNNLSTLWKSLLQVIPTVENVKFTTLDVMTLLSLPDHLRKTASYVCDRGIATADEIADKTKRARAVESGYLNQLVRMGYLKKEREGRKVLFSVIS